MLKYLIILLIFLFLEVHAQKNEKEEPKKDIQNKLSSNPQDTVRLNILSDIHFTKSQSSIVKDGTSGIGNLGISFEQGLFYGKAVFTVFNQQSELSVTDTASSAPPFADNLLVPEKSGKGISSFYGELGRESFLPYDKVKDYVPFISYKRIGFFVSYQGNYTTWIKDTVESRIVINSFDAVLTYKLLDVKIFNSEYDRAYLELYAGFNSRRLGGNFGMKDNGMVRKYFLGSDKRGYNAFQWGARLELGKIFAEFNATHFGGDIRDFSGAQILVTFGLTVDLNLVASPTGEDLEKKKEKKKEKEEKKEEKKKEKMKEKEEIKKKK